MFDPITTTLLKSVKGEAKKHGKEEIIYKIRCPRCSRPVIKKELIKNGCYVCGFRPDK